jgi:uncharacterized protein YwgA
VREAYHKYWDLTAVLYLFNRANTIAPIDGNFKIQKLGFISELRGQEAALRAAHYKFFRYNHGPYSKDLANDVGFLKERGFIDNFNRLTDRGKYLIEYVRPEIAANELSAASIDIVQEVCDEFARFAGIELKRMVYEMSVPVIDYNNCKLKVKDIGYFTDILDPLRLDLKESANFSEDIIDDLKNEFCIPLERLDPSNETVRAQTLDLLQRIA